MLPLFSYQVLSFVSLAVCCNSGLADLDDSRSITATTIHCVMAGDDDGAMSTTDVLARSPRHPAAAGGLSGVTGSTVISSVDGGSEGTIW